jgi:hypothetical protein
MKSVKTTKTSTSTSSIKSEQKNSGRTVNDFKMPLKKDGTQDNRYTTPQFVKKDGTRDMRTTTTNNR